MRTRKLLAACVGVLGGSLASRAHATLTIDLRLSDGSKSAVIDRFGQEFIIDVFAKATGASSLPSKREGVQIITGSFLSTGDAEGFFTAMGDLIDLSSVEFVTGVGLKPFNGLGSQPGWSTDLDGDGDRDLGGPNTDATLVTGHVGLRSPSMFSSGNGQNVEVKVGTLKFTVQRVSQPGTTRIDFLDRRNAAGNPIAGSALWQEDGVSKDTLSGILQISGINLQVSPTYNPRNTQDTPILPNGPWYRSEFNDVPSGMWFGAEYGHCPVHGPETIFQMQSPDSLFTGIVEFPAGYGDAMTIELAHLNLDFNGDGKVDMDYMAIGPFHAGDSVDFANVLVDPDGVGGSPAAPLSAYGVTGVRQFWFQSSVLPSDMLPLAISFSTPTASFQTYVFIPEPATAALLATGVGLLGCRRMRRSA